VSRQAFSDLILGSRFPVTSYISNRLRRAILSCPYAVRTKFAVKALLLAHALVSAFERVNEPEEITFRPTRQLYTRESASALPSGADVFFSMTKRRCIDTETAVVAYSYSPHAEGCEGWGDIFQLEPGTRKPHSARGYNPTAQFMFSMKNHHGCPAKENADMSSAIARPKARVLQSPRFARRRKNGLNRERTLFGAGSVERFYFGSSYRYNILA